MNFKLGKKPARHDPRTYRLAGVLDKLAVPPLTADWSRGIEYDLLGNDRFGDCAFAAQGHIVLTQTTVAQSPIRVPERMALSNYAQNTGFDPATGANDGGTVLLDMLNEWRRAGYARPGGQPGIDVLTAFGAVPITDRMRLARAIYFLGPVIAGVQLPTYLDSEQGDWTYQPHANWRAIGGHCVTVAGYGPAGLIVVTWGKARHVDWRVWDRIADEAYGLISRQNWLGPNGRSPVNEVMSDLVAQLRHSA